jgi:hypothetical protein
MGKQFFACFNIKEGDISLTAFLRKGASKPLFSLLTYHWLSGYYARFSCLLKTFLFPFGFYGCRLPTDRYLPF